MGSNPTFGSIILSTVFARRTFATPSMTPIFFGPTVLQRYATDPHYYFRFNDFVGTLGTVDEYFISNEFPAEDKVLLQTFGMGLSLQRVLPVAAKRGCHRDACVLPRRLLGGGTVPHAATHAHPADPTQSTSQRRAAARSTPPWLRAMLGSAWSSM